MYADDVAIMAENEEGIKELMARLDRYVEKKGQEIDTSKTKIMRYRKRGWEEEKDQMNLEGKGN